jgi:hypothetical protein
MPVNRVYKVFRVKAKTKIENEKTGTINNLLFEASMIMNPKLPLKTECTRE